MPRGIEKNTYFPYYFILGYCLFISIIAFIIDSPKDIIIGLKKIILESDILITDYIELSGIGASFINSSLVITSLIVLLFILKVKPNGAILAGLFTTAGFSLLGKNIINIWPIVIGIFLYSKFKNLSFTNFIVIILFGTTLSPTVGELFFSDFLPISLSIIISLSISIFLGFILVPMASYTLKLHQGYSLSNVGLAGGLIGTGLTSIFRAFGLEPEKKLLWSTGNNTFLFLILLFLFISMILIGYFSDKKCLKNLSAMHNHSGRLISDYYSMFGQSLTFINMGVLGIFATIFVIIVGGDLNGATISGIFTVSGFGAFGKHIKNIIPIIIGATISALLNIWDITSPGMILGILFSTALSPIAGHFGWFYGVLAGFLHICMVMNIGYLHGGMNLYHNGFAAGFVAMILVPIITAFRKEQEFNEPY
ncbi:MAG: DUF1576 domain-containing protein [Clostridium argentinense]|uniref:DUF1576 domain-containing protein n=1 Tax=Clostridium faecium TaxID=2762223 RepID=A0ABR8YX89_9CLOT|nr:MULTISPECIES: DUF1576 domain-containing protein [Clostridium]MBD8048898.1 DUF1576 domain-containing protein [Clostridium faecium]MBS5824190.1 DUF1576 domain-containing protein [Clostridium argentinense]MDU1350799.1 DUF1576 domain-containing protein [Clostridium argentinense]